MTIQIDYERCIACGVCMDNCTFEALELVDGVITWAHPELCESCGICNLVCEKEAITMDNE